MTFLLSVLFLSSDADSEIKTNDFELFSSKLIQQLSQEKDLSKNVVFDIRELELINGEYYIKSEDFSSSTGMVLESYEENNFTFSNDTDTLQVDGDSCDVTLNSEYKIIHSKPQIVDNSLMLPIKEISTLLGYVVSYNNQAIKLSRPYQTKRLIVKSAKKLNSQGAKWVVEGYNNLHIFQYDTEDEAKNAYKFYSNSSLVESVDIDLLVKVQSEEMVESFGLNDSFPYNTWGANVLKTEEYSNYILSKTSENSLPEVVVAVLDSGIDTDHPWFKGRIASGGKNFSSTAGKNLEYEDDDGHGTHVSGIICDLTMSNVKVLPIKVLNNKGETTTSQVLLAVQYVINLKNTMANICAMNLSLGASEVPVGDKTHSALSEVFDKAYNAGILSIVASGNEGIDVSTVAPANIECAITVGAVSQNNGAYCWDDYSNYGTYVDVCAPGTDIISAYLGGGLAKGTGTSMACPHVSACVALLYSNPNKTYTPALAERAIKANCIDLGEEGWDRYYGEGLVNLEYAYADIIDDVSFSEESGTYQNQITLTLSCSYDGSVIYYTTDGSVPTLDSNVYNDAIILSSTTKICVRAFNLYDGQVVGVSKIACKNFDITKSSVDEGGKVEESNEYTIISSCGEGGSITPLGEVIAKEGETKTFLIQANEGYNIVKLVIDGDDYIQSDMSTYVFENITNNHTIYAEFAIDTFTIEITSNYGGDVNPLGTVEVNYGDNLVVNISVYQGYELFSIKFDDDLYTDYTIKNISFYTIKNITNNHTLDIAFAKIARAFFMVQYYTEVLNPTINDYYAGGAYYSLYNSAQFVGVANDDTNIVAPSIMGFTALRIEQQLIKEDNSTIVQVFYKRNSYSLNVTMSAGISNVVVLGGGLYNKSCYKFGEQMTVTAYLQEGYKFVNWSSTTHIVSDKESRVFNFDFPSEDVHIHANAKVQQFSILIEDSPNGTISPNETNYDFGSDVTFSFVPKSEYYLDSVWIDDVNVGKVNTYTFTNLQSNHTIYVSFKINTYTIQISSDDNGSLECSQSLDIVNSGDSRIFKIRPKDGYEIDYLKVNGQNVNIIDNTLTIESIKNDLQIEAIFKKIESSYNSTTSSKSNSTSLSQSTQEKEISIYVGSALGVIIIAVMIWYLIRVIIHKSKRKEK